jgi:hypothetical protein
MPSWAVLSVVLIGPDHRNKAITSFAYDLIVTDLPGLSKYIATGRRPRAATNAARPLLPPSLDAAGAAVLRPSSDTGALLLPL